MRLASIGALALATALLLPSPASAQVQELKFGTLAPDETPWSDILKEFRKNLQRSTGGKIRVKVYLNGILGDEAAMLQKIKFGQLTGGGFTSGGLATIVPEMQVFEIPFLFQNDEEADYIMDQILLEDFRALCASRGLHLYIWAVNGWHDFGSTKGKLVQPGDFNGVKGHMQETDVQRALWNALNADPVPLPVPDVLNGLQRGMITAYSTTPIYATASQRFTITKHWTDSNHIYQPAAVVFDKNWWDGLDADLQKTINAFAEDLQKAARQDVRGIDAELMEEFRANSIDVHTLTAAERATLVEATSGIAKGLIEQGIFEQGLYDKVVNALAEYRAKKGS